MKKITLISILPVLASLIAAPQSVSAHDANGSLGASRAAMDYYQVKCYDDGNGAGSTGRLEVKIKDLSPVAKPLISVQVIRDNIAKNTTDAVDANAAYSPLISFNGGDGFFYMTVDKTAAGVENYSVAYHCLSPSGEHVGTDIFQLTDQ
jgi:hypothetical protein